MNRRRISAVVEAFAGIGYDGILAFDAHEPEFRAFSETVVELGTERHAALLGIIAGSQDFQLAGDAQLFWEELERTVERHAGLRSIDDIVEIMDAFMDRPVNGRFRNMKLSRLWKIYESDFPEWFLKTYDEVEPLEVWRRFAGALQTPMRRKTVALAMKIYDLIYLIAQDDYLNLPGLSVDRVTMGEILCSIHMAHIPKNG